MRLARCFARIECSRIDPKRCLRLSRGRSSSIVIHHVSKPRYVLTITLAADEGGTAITWTQEFEDVAVAARIKHIVEPANEQNLDRLESVLAAAGGRERSRVGR
jgi:hypothetical protein